MFRKKRWVRREIYVCPAMCASFALTLMRWDIVAPNDIIQIHILYLYAPNRRSVRVCVCLCVSVSPSNALNESKTINYQRLAIPLYVPPCTIIIPPFWLFPKVVVWIGSFSERREGNARERIKVEGETHSSSCPIWNLRLMQRAPMMSHSWVSLLSTVTIGFGFR